MSCIQGQTQSFGENGLVEFQKDRQEEFLLEELQGIQEETVYSRDHNKEIYEGCGYEDTSQHSFIIRKCPVCKQEMVVPEQYED